jgi:hypothetical protein
MHRAILTCFLLGACAATATAPPAAEPSAPAGIEALVLHPPYAEYFTCSEHYEGQLSGLGDALGADCSIVEGGSTRRGDGARNEDYYGWNKEVLAPFDAIVERVRVNDVVNTPGTMGSTPSAMVVFRRADDVRVTYAHIQAILVREGDSVSAGQPFARVGNNGYARGPHTHIGAWRDETPLQIRWDLRAMAEVRRRQRGS